MNECNCCVMGERVSQSLRSESLVYIRGLVESELSSSSLVLSGKYDGFGEAGQNNEKL